MNVTDLRYQLKKLLWSDELLLILEDVGWNDGGCRSLMKAFQIWFDSEDVKTYQIVKDSSQWHSEHAFIKIGDWFVDGDGVSSYAQMEYRWLYEEHLPTVIIRDFDPNTEPDLNGEKPYYVSDEKIHQIVRHLDATFHKENILNLLLA
nr:hypothetical protein [Jeotgalibacillus malaysiensis]